MTIRLTVALLALSIPASGFAQSNDAAAERARLANQRIQAEAARQAEEEEKRQAELARLEAEEARLAARQATAVAQQEKEQLAQVEPAAVAAPSGQGPAPPAVTRSRMNKVLEQLQTLGELRDAGYVTDDEFERIKQKILDATD